MTSEQFKQALDTLGLTYKQFAELTGFSYVYIRQIACGNRKPTKYLELFLNVRLGKE